MEISTDSETVRHSRKMVFEFLASSVDLSLVDAETRKWMETYEVDASRYGHSAAPASDRDSRRAGHHRLPELGTAETVDQPVKVHDELYVRDYSKCILCYRCVEACGPDAQNTFAIQVAGRGFDARISTEFDVNLTESACVYCGNCVGVCPTGALMFRSEFELRAADLWDEPAQTVTRTVCSFCGVGCNLDLHVQDNRIVKVTSPMDHAVTSGNLCIKGRFGYDYVQELGDLAETPIDVVLSSVREGASMETDRPRD
jgi:predicted molibdopterin-dependent oxidoreductase YjgC